jgi:hypothetical protein
MLPYHRLADRVAVIATTGKSYRRSAWMLELEWRIGYASSWGRPSPTFAVVRHLKAVALALLVASQSIAQSTPRIGNGVSAAQGVINSMAPGADRAALQAGLDAFKKMDAGGRVSVHPTPGGTGGARDAFTHAEFDVGPGVVSGSGPEVGAGAERTELGPDLVDPSVTSPGLLGAILVHEGIRSTQTFLRLGPLPAGSSYLERCNYWRNEMEVYLLHEKLCAAAFAKAIGDGNEPEANAWHKRRSRRKLRVDEAKLILQLLNCP